MAPERVEHVQPALRTGHPDVGEPALLLDPAVALLEGTDVGQQALLHPGEEHHRELEALDLVQRDQGDTARRVVEGVDVGDEGDVLEELGQPLRRGHVGVLRGQADQFCDVRPALLVLRCAVAKRALVAGLVEDTVQELGQRHPVGEVAQAIDEPAEVGERGPCRRGDLGALVQRGHGLEG